MDVASGLFALGGVGLAAVFGELRAWREFRTSRSSEIERLRRTTYAAALRQVETLASETAKWAVEGGPSAQAWDGLTAAYGILSEVALIAVDQRTPEAMVVVLRAYRDVLQSEERLLPDPGTERQALVDAFRRELGL